MQSYYKGIIEPNMQWEVQRAHQHKDKKHLAKDNAF